MEPVELKSLRAKFGTELSGLYPLPETDSIFYLLIEDYFGFPRTILAMEPEIAILDEPDSGIDIESIERIFDAVRILKNNGTTVIMITHSLAVLDQAEHAFLMCNGTIVDKGEVSKIKSYFEDKCIPCPHKNVPRAAKAGGRA